MPFLSSDHFMHVRCLLDFGCTIIMLNAFVVLLCRDLTTAESRANVWRW